MSVPIDESAIRHIARLSRIALSEDRIPDLVEQLRKIMTYFDKLGELDTEDTKPLARAVDLETVMAADQRTASLPTEAALDAAPERDGNLFRVPKVLGDS